MKKASDENSTFTDQLMQKLRMEYVSADERDILVYPETLAAKVMLDLDPQGNAPLLVSWGCVLELRQLARSICREDKDDRAEAMQETLFGRLQKRYPVKRGEFESYCLRMEMTLGERRANCTRLRNEAHTKMQHADSLEAETQDLLKRGLLSEAA